MTSETARAKFAPLTYVKGYLPLEDFGLIGDGSTAALIGRDGAVAWLCVPRFDSPPIFASILDSGIGGAFATKPEGLKAARQYYEPDTAVLVTEMLTDTGRLRMTDAMLLRTGSDLTEDAPAGRGELARVVEVLSGTVQLRVDVEPIGGAVIERMSGGFDIHSSTRTDLDLHLSSVPTLEGLPTILALTTGKRIEIRLRWDNGSYRFQPSVDLMIEETKRVWRYWLRDFSYEGPQRELVRRSAIALKLLNYLQTGAIIAAPTSSLPEALDGVRNWDYRFSWIRDAAFSVYALRRIGLINEAARYLSWVLDTVEQDGRPKVLYDVDGQTPPAESIDPLLEGYRGSRPVRWGNAAADQHQHDVFGEILDCAYQWVSRGGDIDEQLSQRLLGFVEAARIEWRHSDHGIWEVRTPGRPFTYSAALCHVALDRGARLAERFKLPGQPETWRVEADLIRKAILNEAWDERRGAITEHLGGGGLDASVLALPLRRVLPADHPRMIATTAAIQRELGAGNGLIYRYLQEKSPDGVPGSEGAFLLCSFWLVDNLAYQGRLDEAQTLYDSLCSRSGPLGLLSEQIDPLSNAFLGNYPQALSHVGLISSGINLHGLQHKKS